VAKQTDEVVDPTTLSSKRMLKIVMKRVFGDQSWEEGARVRHTKNANP